jgi:hypothetical protein
MNMRKYSLSAIGHDMKWIVKASVRTLNMQDSVMEVLPTADDVIVLYKRGKGLARGGVTLGNLRRMEQEYKVMGFELKGESSTFFLSSTVHAVVSSF